MSVPISAHLVCARVVHRVVRHRRCPVARRLPLWRLSPAVIWRRVTWLRQTMTPNLPIISTSPAVCLVTTALLFSGKLRPLCFCHSFFSASEIPVQCTYTVYIAYCIGRGVNLYSLTRQGSFCFHCWKAAGTPGNGDPIVKMSKNALWTALRTIFRPKCTRLQGFAYSLEIFPRKMPLNPRKSAPGGWIQTPISGWLASVPIVSVLRNDYCHTRSLARSACHRVSWWKIRQFIRLCTQSSSVAARGR